MELFLIQFLRFLRTSLLLTFMLMIIIIFDFECFTVAQFILVEAIQNLSRAITDIICTTILTQLLIFFQLAALLVTILFSAIAEVLKIVASVRQVRYHELCSFSFSRPTDTRNNDLLIHYVCLHRTECLFSHPE